MKTLYIEDYIQLGEEFKKSTLEEFNVGNIGRNFQKITSRLQTCDQMIKEGTDWLLAGFTQVELSTLIKK